MSDRTRNESPGRTPDTIPLEAPVELHEVVGQGPANDEPVTGGEGGLYSDAWRLLRKRPMFVVSGLLIILLIKPHGLFGIHEIERV